MNAYKLKMVIVCIFTAFVANTADAQRLTAAERERKIREAQEFFQQKKKELAERKAKEAALAPKQNETSRKLASAGAAIKENAAKRAEDEKVTAERIKRLEDQVQKSDISKEARETLASDPPPAKRVGNVVPTAKPVPLNPRRAGSVLPAIPNKPKPAKPPAPGLRAVDAGGVPVPAKPEIPNLTAGDNDARKPGEIVVTSKGGAQFNDTDRMVIFIDEVHVDHPTFIIDCGLLELWLEDDALDPKKKKAPDGAKPAAKPDGKKDMAAQTSIRKAVASKGTVTIQKRNPDGSLEVGKARRVEYDGRTGDSVLKGMPQVQKGNKQIIAKAEETIIILHANGKNPKVVGPHQVRLAGSKPATAANR